VERTRQRLRLMVGFGKVVSRESFARSRGHLYPTARSARRGPRRLRSLRF